MAREFNPITFSKGVLRRAMKKTRAYNQCMAAAKRQTPMTKKDGTTSKKYTVDFQCAECEQWFVRKEVNVDHIEPVMPVDRELSGIEEWIIRLYCEVDQLQVLCTGCHKKKSHEENKARREWRKNVKAAANDS